jgi:hypothetical protein
LEITAPELSLTVPVSSAVVSAAREGNAEKTKRAKKILEWRTVLRVREYSRIRDAPWKVA